MPSARWFFAVVGAVGLLFVASQIPQAISEIPLRSVDRDADARAGRAAVVMSREKRGDARVIAWHVTGGDPSPRGEGAAIEALLAVGDRFDGRIVLRITERHEEDGWSPASEAVRCYAYELRGGVKGPARIGCPDAEPIDLPAPPPPPRIPAGAEDRVEAMLRALTPERRTVPLVRDAARAAAGAPVIEVEAVDGAIGVAVGNGEADCEFFRVTATAVERWRVPPVMAVPGELGCDAGAAALGQGKLGP